MKRITNVDTISALIDRLITENIKLYFFQKNEETDSIIHQRDVILELKLRISDLIVKCLEEKDYDHLGERRTWSTKFTDQIEYLTQFDIHIGEADREKLKQLDSDDPSLSILLHQEKRMRVANEGRATSKNKIDDFFKKMVGMKIWKR